VESVQKEVDQLRDELDAYAEALRAQLAAAEEAVQEDVAPEPAGIPTGSWTKPERRKRPRRKSVPVPVQLSYSKTGDDPFRGWAVDCSSIGVGIIVEKAQPVNSNLALRATHGNGKSRWLQVNVVNCRINKGKWHLGCKFLQELSDEEMGLLRQ
jgi:hypothetical protein